MKQLRVKEFYAVIYFLKQRMQQQQKLKIK